MKFRAHVARGKCSYKFGSHYPEEIRKGGGEGKNGNVRTRCVYYPAQVNAILSLGQWERISWSPNLIKFLTATK